MDDGPRRTPAGSGQATRVGSVRGSLPFSGDRLIPRLRDAFSEDCELMRLRGLPIRAYCLRHPDLVKQVYTHPVVGSSKRPGLLPRVHWIMRRGGFIHKGGDAWKRKRQALQPAMTRGNSQQFADKCGAALAALFARWDRAMERAQEVDLLWDFSRFSVDWTFQSLFSVTLDDERLDDVTQSSRYMLETFDANLPVWVPTPDNFRFRFLARRLQRIVDEVIAERRRMGDDCVDLFSPMSDWSDEEIRDEIFSIYLGATIIGVVLVWIFGALSENGAVLKALQSEVQQAFQGDEPTCADLERVQYPHMVFQETTRLFPPVWSIPRWAPEPLILAGVTIPGRSLLLPISQLAHRHPSFWSDPDQFLPERFGPENSARIHPFAHFPFGGGPRMCLGRNVAPLVCQLAMVRILQKYAVQTTAKLQPHFGFETRPANPAMAKLTPVSATSSETVPRSTGADRQTAPSGDAPAPPHKPALSQ